MLIKTALRFYLTTVTMASIKETNKSKRGQGYRERTTLMHWKENLCSQCRNQHRGWGRVFVFVFYCCEKKKKTTMAKKPAYYRSI